MAKNKQHDQDSRAVSPKWLGTLFRWLTFILSFSCLALSMLFLLSNWLPWLESASSHFLAVPFMVFGSQWDSEAVAQVISMVGVTGIAFAWLVTAADRQVLGVSIGTLIHWAYPGTYKFYFFCYLPLVFIGLYAGHSDMRVAAPVAAVGVLVSAVYLLRICYRVLLNEEAREALIYEYYQGLLTPEDGGPADFASIIHRTAACAHQQLVYEYRLHGKDTFQIWTEAAKAVVKDCSDPIHPEDSACSRLSRGYFLHHIFLSGKSCGELSAVFLLENGWLTLLSPPMPPYKRKLAVRELLSGLDPNKTRTPEEIGLTAGLILALHSLHQNDADPLGEAWKELQFLLGPVDDQINCHNLAPALQKDLLWGFGMLLSAKWLWDEDREHIRSILEEFSVLFSPAKDSHWEDDVSFALETSVNSTPDAVVRESLNKVLADTRAGNLEFLMWLIEWGFNLKRLGFDCVAYLDRISKCFSSGGTALSAYRFGNIYYHRWLLVSLIDQINFPTDGRDMPHVQ